MKTLVLAEKPSVGKDIARVLKCNKSGNGYLEGDQYIVTWALGHLVTLADPERYDDRYKTWKIDDLPMLPSPLKLEVIGKTAKQYGQVKAQMSRNDVKDIVIATDAGREGELVARWIIEKSGVKKPIRRLWISSVTDQAIREGFSKLQPGEKYLPLFQAALARSEADWYVGLNATRALTCKYNAQLSCGRVQTPTLAIVASRDKEIREFKSVPYYTLTAVCAGFELHYKDPSSGNSRFFDQKTVESLKSSLEGQKLTVTDVIGTPKKTYAPRLYDLTELQRDANKMFGYSAKETLNVMQNLYERHKVLTYPRTDSRYISTDIVPTIKQRLEACSVGPYAKHARKILMQPIKGASHFVDNGKVSDHHAIIPTETTPFFKDFADKELKIYDLVVKRFLSVLFPPFEFIQTNVKGHIGNSVFHAMGKIVTAEGWKAVYEYEIEEKDEDELDQRLPELKKGQVLPVTKLVIDSAKTKPPAPFTEATLLTAMENPSKYMESNDKALIKTLGETSGLGTVATRADIIEKLLDSFVIEKRGNQLFVTAKGLQLLELVPGELKSPLLTAKWETTLQQIAKGASQRQPFINEMKAYTGKIVGEIKNSTEQFKHNNVTGNRCPDCGKFLLEVNGKKGKMLVCQDRDCGYRKSETVITNARCPECHKKLELHGKGDGQIFVCKNCGHREKMSSFEARKKSEGASVSKQDVARFMNQQQKVEEPMINSAFADLLKKL